MISNFINVENEGLVSWEHSGETITKKFPGRAFAYNIVNDSAVIVVYFYEGMGKDNAIIYNSDGSKRCDVENPCKDKGSICFEDVYYVNDELTLIIAFKDFQMACVIDTFGKVIRLYETR